MPKLWTETIDAHRREVRDAVLDATAALVGEHGLLSVTMSQIAATTGIGRATLYKYFPDVATILLAWHEREVDRHLRHLGEVRDRSRASLDRLEAVLNAYAVISHESHEHHDAELAAFLHRGDHVGRAQQQLRHMLAELIAAAARDGAVRADVSPDELADYCLHALAAAATAPSKASVRRLVDVVRAGLRASSGPAAG